jgi:hypothetical protein
MGWIRSLELPAGVDPPPELRYQDIVARAISRADLAADVAGINASLDIIRRTRGGDWPSGPVTEEFDFVDLVWHELEFRDRTSFTYAVYDLGDRYLGCCYLFPIGRRTPLDDELARYDVDVSWWVTPEAYDRSEYVKLYRALRQWVVEGFGWTNPYFSNHEIPRA